MPSKQDKNKPANAHEVKKKNASYCTGENLYANSEMEFD